MFFLKTKWSGEVKKQPIILRNLNNFNGILLKATTSIGTHRYIIEKKHHLKKGLIGNIS